jgi:predicted acetyltransferase
VAARAAAVLTASESGIYGRFGYGWATGKCDYELDKRVARLARPVTAPGAVRMLTPAQAEEAAPALWEAHRRLRPGEQSVPPTYWWGHFNVREWTGADPDRRFFAAYEHEGVIEGLVDFVRVEVESGPRERAVAVELFFVSSREAYEALCAFLIGIDLAITLRMSHRPLDEPLRHLLADGRQLRTTRTVDDVWIRPLDVRAALSARRYVPVGGEPLVLHVHDELLPANEGCYTLSVDGSGSPSVSGPEPAGPGGAGGAALELDVGALGSVLLGGRRLAPFVQSGLVREHTPGAAWRADAMFLAEREPFATISF